MIIFYSIICLILLTILFMLFIKIKFPFWAAQPVFHVYNITYYIYPCGIIQDSLPEKTRYHDSSISVVTVNDDVLTILGTNVTSFLQTHYLKTPEASFLPKKDNIVPYFIGHLSPCHLSTLTMSMPVINNNSGTVIIRDTLAASMTTRPIYVEMFTDNGTSIADKFEINYVDHLCVNMDKRKQGIAPKIIYTHNYVIQRANHRVPISLFKREDDITGIVPLCFYKTVCFDMSKWTTLPTLPANMGTLVKCDAGKYYLVEDFIRNKKNMFNICITPSIGNIISLIQTENIYVYMLVNVKQQIDAVYFFRNTCMRYENDESALCLFASIRGQTQLELFTHTCKIAITKIVADTSTNTDTNTENNKYKYRYFTVENISDNILITDELQKKSTPVSSSPTAYFFYNFASHIVSENKVFILN